MSDTYNVNDVIKNNLIIKLGDYIKHGNHIFRVADSKWKVGFNEPFSIEYTCEEEDFMFNRLGVEYMPYKIVFSVYPQIGSGDITFEDGKVIYNNKEQKKDTKEFLDLL